MQSIAEIEAICERNTLAQAEAHMNAQDEEPTARECFDNCVHAEACYRIHYGQNDEPEDREEAIAEFLEASGCAEECQEYEDAWCPMSWSGTMRCRGPKKEER